MKQVTIRLANFILETVIKVELEQEVGHYEESFI